MARIELSFYDKKYTIEYNRVSVKEFLQLKGTGDEIDQAVALIKCGLAMHHKNDMPKDSEVLGWVMALGEDLKEFADALTGMVQDVLTTLQTDRKNLKWAKVEA